MVPAAIRLARSYDVDQLLEDLASCERLHYKYVSQTAADGESHHDDWTVLPLRSRGAHIDDGSPGTASIEPYRDTELMAHTPYFRSIVEELGNTATSVRLSALGPGGKIKPHNDGAEFELGKGEEIRLHIPIRTSDHIAFLIDGQPYRWRPGELWYGDFSKTHSVENHGGDVRIHLLITTRLSAPLIELFPRDYLAGRTLEPYATLATPPAALLDRVQVDFALAPTPRFEELVQRDPDDPFMDDTVAKPLREALLAMMRGPSAIKRIDGHLRVVSGGVPTFYLAFETERRLRIVDEAAYFELSPTGALNLTFHACVLGENFRIAARVA